MKPKSKQFEELLSKILENPSGKYCYSRTVVKSDPSDPDNISGMKAVIRPVEKDSSSTSIDIDLHEDESNEEQWIVDIRTYNPDTKEETVMSKTEALEFVHAKERQFLKHTRDSLLS